MKSFILVLMLSLIIVQIARAEEDEESANTQGTKYFSVPAFFVTFREAIEASVIVSILLRFL